MGSKAKYAKFIVPILMDGHNQSKPYIEPFVGGGNLFSEVPAKFKWGNDTAIYAVALLKALSEGWVPPEVVTEDEYYRVKANQDTEAEYYVGFVAYCCSYAGKFWGGYARGVDAKGIERNFASEQVRNLEKQRNGLVGSHFTTLHYRDLLIPDGSTVYCDPPYEGTTGYKNPFDHDTFWNWVEGLSHRCRVFVSEYSCPFETDIVWHKTVTNSLTKDTGSKLGTEKLFRIKPYEYADGRSVANY